MEVVPPSGVPPSEPGPVGATAGAMADAPPCASDLKRMRVEDLRTMLSEHELDTKGRKASLVGRLIDHMAIG